MASIYRSSLMTQNVGRIGLGAAVSVALAATAAPLVLSHRALSGWLALLLLAFGLGLICGRYAGDLEPHLQRWQQARLARRAQHLNRTSPPG